MNGTSVRNTHVPGGKQPDYLVFTKDGKPIDIRAQARLDGKAQLPPSSAMELNETELAIVGQFEGEYLNAAEAAQAAVNGHCASIDALVDRIPQVAELDNLVDECHTQIEHALLGNGELHRLLEAYQAHRAARLHFPREHNLFREPSYPASQLLHFAPLAVLLLVETLLNGYFFAEHDPLGLLGGILRAAWISGINVVVSTLIGRFVVRYVNHVLPPVKRRAVIATAAYVFSAVAFNLAAACYRDAYATGGGVTHESVLGLFRGTAALSFQSFLMLAAGLVTCGLALLKGYTSNDPYPGYAETDCAYVNARKALDTAAERAKRDLLARAAAVDSLADGVVARGEALLQQGSQALTAAGGVVDSAEADRVRLQDRAKIFLSFYRGEDRLYRHEPPPAYFDTYPEFEGLVDRKPLWRAQQQLQLVRHAVESLKARRSEIKAAGVRRAAQTEQRFHQFLSTGHWMPQAPDVPPLSAVRASAREASRS